MVTPGLLSPASFLTAGARGTSPGEQVLLASPSSAPSGNPAAEQMAGRFFLPRHPVRGRLGGPGCRLPHEPGNGAPGGLPGCGPPPRLAGVWWGGGEPATALRVPREAWEGGSLCPAHWEQTHRTPEGQALALRGWRPGNEIRRGGHKRGPLAQNRSFESWPSCHVTWRRVPERVMSGEMCTGAGGLEGSRPEEAIPSGGMGRVELTGCPAVSPPPRGT